METLLKSSLLRRMRRNRGSKAIRTLICETELQPYDLIQPLFVKEGLTQQEEIPSMPGMHRLSVEACVEECKKCESVGLQAVALFPVIDNAKKDPKGNYALACENILFEAIRAVKTACPGLIVMTDVALDPYTSHGHDGILNVTEDHVLNDETVALLCALALKQAEYGVDFVAPSDMMDGRVRAIRKTLDTADFINVGIMSYAAKYASAFYGPFREAVASKMGKVPLDKRGYQMDPSNVREALLEVKLDEEEGADIIMVKPAGPYLDVIRAVRECTLLPLAAYQVSGEYAQIHAAARLGWLDYKKTRNESLLAIKRAGADMIFSYFAKEFAEERGAVKNC